MSAVKQTADALYTICPVFVASNVAAEKGWLQEEFEKSGVSLRYLRSLPDIRAGCRITSTACPTFSGTAEPFRR